MTTDTKAIPRPSGYAPTDDYFATLSRQSVLTMVSLTLTWPRLVEMVVPPDPNKKSDYNRPLTVPHAKRFGQYVDITEDPFTPPITLFTDPGNVTLESLGDETLDDYGLKLAKVNRDAQIFILDGQHRIYGIKLLLEEYLNKHEKAKQAYQQARRNGPDELVTTHRAKVKEWKQKIDRLNKIEVTAQILLTAQGDQAKRIFTDVADNAKGISRSQLADFSDRSVFNRVAREISSTLLQGVVDPVHDRMSAKNPHWLALKDIVNCVQAVEVSLGQRWSSKRETELKHRETAIEATARSFFEGLIEVFPDVGSMIDGTLAPRELRPGGSTPSLLGSASMIRGLAAAYRRLRIGEKDEDGKAWKHKPMKHAEIVSIWEKALPPMTAGNVPDPSGDKDKAEPLVDNAWLTTKAFAYPFYAPGGRLGDLNAVADAVTSWSREAAK